jgi:hypothetical protein
LLVLFTSVNGLWRKLYCHEILVVWIEYLPSPERIEVGCVSIKIPSSP